MKKKSSDVKVTLNLSKIGNVFLKVASIPSLLFGIHLFRLYYNNYYRWPDHCGHINFCELPNGKLLETGYNDALIIFAMPFFILGLIGLGKWIGKKLFWKGATIASLLSGLYFLWQFFEYHRAYAKWQDYIDSRGNCIEYVSPLLCDGNGHESLKWAILLLFLGFLGILKWIHDHFKKRNNGIKLH